MKFFLLGAAASFFGAAAEECEYVTGVSGYCNAGFACFECTSSTPGCQQLVGQVAVCAHDDPVRYSTDAPTTAEPSPAPASLDWFESSNQGCPSNIHDILTEEDCQAAADEAGPFGVVIVTSGINDPFGCTVQGGRVAFSDRGSFDAYSGLTVLCDQRTLRDSEQTRIADSGGDGACGSDNVVLNIAQCRLFAHENADQPLLVSENSNRPRGCYAYVRSGRDTRFYFSTASSGATTDKYGNICVSN